MRGGASGDLPFSNGLVQPAIASTASSTASIRLKINGISLAPDIKEYTKKRILLTRAAQSNDIQRLCQGK
jgi:hypothetical protein